MKRAILLALAVASLTVGFVVLRGSADTDVAPHGSIFVSPASVDFGDIVQSAGIVSTTVRVKNTGSASLVFRRISTSCGCTTTDMDPSDLLPNEERDLVIRFDPMAHPDQFGPIVRVVYLQTSDPDSPETEIDVTGNVIQ